MPNPYAATTDTPVSRLHVDARARFLVRTYGHLAGAILAFTLLETAFFAWGVAESIARTLSGSWLLVLGGLMLVSWLATRTAHGSRSLVAQYAGLAAFVVAEAFVFCPLIYFAHVYAGGGVIESAALVTLVGFGGLTAIAFWTRKDFSFMGALLRWVGFGALLAIVAAVIFGLQLGTWFSVGMIVFAGAAILYDTSRVLHHYPEDRYVGASLELFASVALMFFYVLRLFLASRD